MPEAMHLKHFAGGLRTDSAIFLDKASGGSFWHKTVSEGKAIHDRILKNTTYTGIYDDPPEESREHAERAKTFFQTPTPCPQKIAEPEPPALDPKPFSEDYRPFFLSMFDDDESTVDGDVSSSPREESDAYKESEVVTPDPEEESLSDTDQVKEDSSFHNLEFQFTEDEFVFSEEEFKAPISPSSSKLQESYQYPYPFCDPE
jgi:hypothetical protein